MADDGTQDITYEARRGARGGDLPPKQKSWRRRLILGGAILAMLILGTVGYIVVWSLTHVTTVRAQVCAAVVSLASEVDARMVELCVHPGQLVDKGEVLARLDDSELRAALRSAEASQAIRRSLHAQAVAALEVTKGNVEADIALARARVAVAKARLGRAQSGSDGRSARLPEEVRRAAALYEESKARLARLRKGYRKEELEVAKVRLLTARARGALVALEKKQVEELVKRNVESRLALEISKTELTAQQNTVREAELELAKLLAGPDQDEVKAAEQAVAALAAALSLARLGAEEVKSLKAEMAVRRAELKESEAELLRAEGGRPQIKYAEEQVKREEAEMRKAEADVAARRAALQNMTIRSPVAGTVIRTFQREGEICRKGIPTILVADDSAGRWIEGFVQESDAARLKIGQAAEVETVVGSREYIQAVVQDVALATSSLSRAEGASAGSAFGAGSGELVWVKLKPDQPIGRLLPGMSARSVIRVGW